MSQASAKHLDYNRAYGSLDIVALRAKTYDGAGGCAAYVPALMSFTATTSDAIAAASAPTR